MSFEVYVQNQVLEITCNGQVVDTVRVLLVEQQGVLLSVRSIFADPHAGTVSKYFHVPAGEVCQKGTDQVIATVEAGWRPLIPSNHPAYAYTLNPTSPKHEMRVVSIT